MTLPQRLQRLRPVLDHVDRLSIVVLAVLAYVPTLLSSPGRMPADTKAYLYFDPGRLTTDAPWTFDPRQFAGWVPHQHITYLWPSGPWYWFWETLGAPDWLAHRLWLGTIFFLAGLGIRWLARHLGLGPAGALVAAVVYQLSPYVLPYVSRTSLMLLPWAGLGWIVTLTIRAATRSSWRDVGILALVIATVGSPNATALAMIAPAPVLWLVHAAWGREITWRRAGITAAKVGAMGIGVSLWWMAMLVVQGRHGADVLGYSESLEAVSMSSVSSEVLRGLGYWLFYLRDAYAPTTSTGADYMTNEAMILAGYVVLAMCCAGLALTSWRHRRFAIWTFAAGVMLAVGVHRLADPSPAVDALVGDTESGLALALRSSTRALPMATLGLALGAGALVSAVRPRRSWVRAAVPAIVVVAAFANMPSLWRRDYVDPALARDEDPPAAWDEAVAALDAAEPGYRVLELPGQEFGAYRWGYTVDQPLPGLTDRDVVTRELLPLGSPMAMDLLFALDDRFQEGVAEDASIAPVARLLGAATIWVPNDAAFDRFRTPRPELTTALYTDDAADLGEALAYGEPTVNVPDIDMVDEQAVTEPAVGQPVPPVMLVPVDDPLPIVRAKRDTVLVSGSGDGIVDAAAAGIIDGTELLRYTADLHGEALDAAIGEATALIVTDSNRDRAHRWASSQDAVGFTESGGLATDLLRLESADARLPVFATTEGRRQTVATQRGPVTAVATAYGEPFAYRPEHRAAMAIDGDPSTAWLVADRFAADGERIVLTTEEGIDHLTLLQPRFAERQRHLTAVDVRIDDRPVERVDLGPQSYTRPGQRLDFEPTSAATTVEITVADTESPVPVPGPALAAVGFAEIDTGLGPSREIVRPPIEVLSRLGPGDADTPLSLAFTRLRHRPTDRFRADPEPSLRRVFPLGAPRSFDDVAVTVRLDQRAGDAVLNELLGLDAPVASDRVAGVAAAAAWATVDGDRETAWISPFAYPGEHTITVPLQATDTIDELVITQPDDPARFSTITKVTVSGGGTTSTADVAPPDENGESVVRLEEAITADEVRIRVAEFDGIVVTDRRYAEPVYLPVAISELSIGAPVTLPDALSIPCRDDLVLIDGEPLGVELSGDTQDVLGGAPFEATLCDADPVDLDEGPHRIASDSRKSSGLQVDRLVLGSNVASAEVAAPLVEASVVSSSRTSMRVEVGPCPDGCWIVLGHGYNSAWTASSVPNRAVPDTPDPGAPTDRGITTYLGSPLPVDGGFNGWYLAPSNRPVNVTIEWTAQPRATYGLLASGVFVALAVAMILVDRRRQPPTAAVDQRPAMWSWRAQEPMWRVAVGVVLAVIGAALFVKPLWALPVLAVGAVAVALRRSRIAALAGVAVAVFVGGSTTYTVWREDPFPSGFWLRSVEPLHLVGLLVVVLMFAASVIPDDAEADGDVTAAADESPPG